MSKCKKIILFFAIYTVCAVMSGDPVARAGNLPTLQQVTAAREKFVEVPMPPEELNRLRALYKATPNQKTYTRVTYTRASQNRLSYIREMEKVAAITDKVGALWSADGVTNLSFDNGRSLVPDTLAAPVALMAKGLAVADSTHEEAVGISAASITFPITIIDDVSSIADEEEAWAELERRGLAYLVNIDGTKTTKPVGFAHLQDDPNRYLASLICRKIKGADSDSEEGRKLGFATFSDQQIWVKIGKSVPFIEFKIADILYRAGVVYDPAQGKKLEPKFVEKVRKILLTEKQKGSADLKDIAILPGKIPEKFKLKDPNLHLARLTARVIGKDDDKLADVNDRMITPVWLVKEDEFENARTAVALALYRHGVVYDWNLETKVPKSLAAQVAKILSEEKSKDPAFKNIIVSDIPKKVSACAELLEL